MSNYITSSYDRIVPNVNKIITITRNGQHEVKGSNGETINRSDWRQALSSVMACYSTSDGQMLKAVNDLDVSDKIQLVFTSAYPEISLTNTFNYPVETLYKRLIAKAEKSINNVTQASMGLDLKDIGGLEGAISLVSGVVSSAANAIAGNGSVKTASSFQPWATKIPAADPSKIEPITFQYTFKFSLGQYDLWNAKEEVVKPILNLMVPTLPQHLNAAFINPAFPPTGQLITNIIEEAFKKDTYTSAFSGGDGEEGTGVTGKVGDFLTGIGNVLENLALGATNSYSYRVKFGSFIDFPKCYITSSKVQFSEKTDQYGYPISGSITLGFKSILPQALTSSNVNTMAIRYNV